MSRSRYGRRKSGRPISEWLGASVLAMLLLLLISSIWTEKDPVNMVKSLMSGDSQKSESQLPYDTLVNIHDRQHKKILKLEEELAICNGQKQYKRGLIDIESNTVNMRSQASLSSDIVLQIPDSSIVQILYYDTERYILNEKFGKWCRISYAGTEGWVSGNLVKELD